METLQYLMTGFGVALSTTNLMVAAMKLKKLLRGDNSGSGLAA